MRLYDKLPDSVVVNGKKIRLNLDFRNVLRMMDILSDDGLMPDARKYLALKCICKHPRDGMMQEVRKLLFGDDPVEWHERVTDFSQDAEMILAAFRQVYGINLLKDRLHWFEFSALISNLPTTGNKYSDVVSIRARPMPVANQYNTEERQWLAKAKLHYMLKYSEREQEEMFKRSLSSLASGFSSMAGGEKH